MESLNSMGSLGFESYGPPRRASINSFGFGGANGHCIIDHVNDVLPTYVKPGTDNQPVNGCRPKWISSQWFQPNAYKRETDFQRSCQDEKNHEDGQVTMLELAGALFGLNAEIDLVSIKISAGRTVALSLRKENSEASEELTSASR
ncbi:hypothetical protein GGS20DRAFT_585529 [Poronia punctata]|nr:hypothetical protein GGS20DRAFT_585529 [Poronia punctata]